MKTIFYEVVINLADLEDFYSLFLLLIWSQKKILNSLLPDNLRGSQKFMTYLGTPKTCLLSWQTIFHYRVLISSLTGFFYINFFTP